MLFLCTLASVFWLHCFLIGYIFVIFLDLLFFNENGFFYSCVTFLYIGHLFIGFSFVYHRFSGFHLPMVFSYAFLVFGLRECFCAYDHSKLHDISVPIACHVCSCLGHVIACCRTCRSNRQTSNG